MYRCCGLKRRRGERGVSDDVSNTKWEAFLEGYLEWITYKCPEVDMEKCETRKVQDGPIN